MGTVGTIDIKDDKGNILVKNYKIHSFEDWLKTPDPTMTRLDREMKLLNAMRKKKRSFLQTIKDSLVEILIFVAVMAILVTHIILWIDRSTHKRNTPRTQPYANQTDSPHEIITM